MAMVMLLNELWQRLFGDSDNRVKMTNYDIKQTAYRQSALDLSCDESDFEKNNNVIVCSRPNERARQYLSLPFFCNLVSYGKNIVASVDPRIVDFITRYINQYDTKQCFETPNLLLLTEEFKKYHYMPCYMAEYFLPDMNCLQEIECGYEIKVLYPDMFSALYLPQWSNALCEKRKQLDVLAVGAYDHGKLIGLAGCSADCRDMWQIGIDVLTEYRRQGVAIALTSRLALEILNRGKVPFYCAAWSNIPSVRNAIRSGFRPAWIELTAIPNTEAQKILKPNRL